MEPALDRAACPSPDPGARLAAQERRLRLLLAHLAGHAVRARVELEDLLQEVYLRALTGRAGLPPVEDGDGALWRILARLARQVVIDVARAIRTVKRSGAREELLRSDWSRAGAASHPACPSPGPATEVATAETSRRLARRFLELPADQRRVIGLRQFQGLSARDTAGRMGRSESAVNSLYRRALSAWEGNAGENRGARDESAAGRRLEAP